MGKRQGDLRSEVLGFLERFFQENGYAPTCEEIREGVGLSSRSHAAYYLDALEEDGLIERTPRLPRNVRLTHDSPVSNSGNANHTAGPSSTVAGGREP